MRSIVNRGIFLLLVVLGSGRVNAQTEMADKMRADGKIYVVVVVLATIFVGIFAYLFILDRRLSKLEKETK